MFTEPGEAERANELESFLDTKVVSTEVLTVLNRLSYFKSASIDHHLFIDPNTGLRLGDLGGRKALDYLFASELLLITQERENYLTMVFDQSLSRAAEDVRREEVRRKLNELRARGLFGFAYYSHVCFLVLSKDESLVNEARNRLNQGLGLPRSRLVES